MTQDKAQGGVYLDNNSTTRAHPEVTAAMIRALESGAGNASSAHDRGALARRMLVEARDKVSELCGTSAENVVFTSGATEANNLVLKIPAAGQGAPISRVVTSTIEHSSVLGPCTALEESGVEVAWVRPSTDGKISPEDVANAGIGPNTLVSLHWVNNETGVIQPVEEIAEMAKAAGALLHVDAAQALGRMPVDFDRMGFNYMTGSAHKLHGPQGVGMLVVRDGSPMIPLAHGGGQEGGVRPGTENLSGIVGFGAAAKLAAEGLPGDVERVRSLRDSLEEQTRAQIPSATPNGARVERVAGTTNLRFPGIDGQAIVALMNQREVYISQSSACTNMRPEPSYVLREMGFSEEEAYESVRMCVSTDTIVEEVAEAVARLTEVVGLLGGKIVALGENQNTEAAAR